MLHRRLLKTFASLNANGSRLPAAVNTAIVGAGPCGLVLGLLLHEQGVEDFAVLEKKNKLQLLHAHPAAHYINARSMECLKLLEHLQQRVVQEAEPLERYRYYRYVRHVGGFEFQKTDQLAPQALKELWEKTGEMPVHMPQHTFVRLLLDEYDRRGIGSKLVFDCNASRLQQQANSVRCSLRPQR